MKKHGRDIMEMLLIFAGLMLWGCAVSKYGDLSRSFGGISLRFETNPQDIENIVELRSRQKEAGTDSKLTAWRQDYGLKIEDRDLGLRIESDVIYMWGDGKDLPDTYGASGCVISGDKAYELWGSRDVLGKTVYIDGVSYKVTAVTDSMRGIIAVKRDDYETGVKFVSLDMEPKSNRSESNESDARIEEFMLQNSYGADSSINYSALLSVLGNFPVLPALAISALMSVRILSGLYRAVKHKNGYMAIAYHAFFLILWVCICFFAGSFSLEIPGNFIPTKWSDFDFWSGLAERYKGDLRGLRLMPVYALDGYFRKSYVCVSAWGLLSSLCFAAALRHARNKSLGCLMALEAVSAFIMFCAAAVPGARYGSYSRAYWIILPTYFVFDFFINNFSLCERT